MLILNIFIYKKIYDFFFENLQHIIFVQMYEIMKFQMHFQSNYLIFLLNFFYRCINIGKIFKNEIYLFSFGQSMKIYNNGQSWIF
jgi:hypothetical protein